MQRAPRHRAACQIGKYGALPPGIPLSYTGDETSFFTKTQKMEQQQQKRPLDVYKLVTDRIVELLENGTVPWRRTWTEAGPPMNLVTRRQYSGINLLLLAAAGYESNLFLTYEQAKDLGGSVRKGEKAHMVVFVKRTRVPEEQNDGEGETGSRTRMLSVLRYYSVFNVSQCEGLPEDVVPPPQTMPEPLPLCMRVVDLMRERPAIVHGGDIAAYSPATDTITIPQPSRFESPREYYAVLFHELVHSTGHPKRLNRREVAEYVGNRGSKAYAAEELTAELGACYLRSFAGIGDVPLDNHAAYVATWLGRLKNDRRLLFRAASQAQRATDWILNVEREYGTEDESNGKE